MDNMNKVAVVINRQWGNPTISVQVTATEINISMEMSDFIRAVGTEIGNPTLLLTTNALINSLNVAADKICAEMKTATKQVM